MRLHHRQQQRWRAAAAVVACCVALAAAGAAAWPLQQHAGHGHSSSSTRRLLIRPFPKGDNACRNTMQGPLFMTDDRGKVCPADSLDYATGCCSSGELHACSKCDKVDDCCENFEHCVSCCMAPEHKPDERRQLVYRVPNQRDSGIWADAFEYCSSACRTHSRSTSHENAYIGPRHHCFSKLGKPLLSAPLPPGALDGVSVLLSAVGASCSAMCSSKGLACSQPHLALLNSCDQLREVLNCEAGCMAEDPGAGASSLAALPAAVDPEAPKAARPALCLVAPLAGATSSGGGSSSSSSSSSAASGDGDGVRHRRLAKQDDGAAAAGAFSCDATANHLRRLCACTKAGGGDATAASSSSDASKSAGADASKSAGADASKSADAKAAPAATPAKAVPAAAPASAPAAAPSSGADAKVLSPAAQQAVEYGVSAADAAGKPQPPARAGDDVDDEYIPGAYDASAARRRVRRAQRRRRRRRDGV